MPVTISGSVALVTGANRGIGRALVESLLDKGAAKVYACARKPESLAELLELHGDRVVAIELDVTNAEQIKSAAKAAPDVSLLINNAGVAGPWSVSVTDPKNHEFIRDEFEVNLFGSLSMSQAFAPILAANGGGGLVNILSVAALVNFPPAITYSMSKAALHSMTQALRFELRAQGTQVTGVYPGPIDTDMADGLPFDKAPPNVAADNILSGVEEGQEENFPDPMSKEMGAGYEQSPKGLEAQIAAMSEG
jgi:NAD(P)-dependent dehydrogenase (short-subunit alcohol dehydrogenase family)